MLTPRKALPQSRLLNFSYLNKLILWRSAFADMDPLTAVGIACNVMQVISFSRELISVAHHVYDKGAINESTMDKATHLKALAASIDIDTRNLGCPRSASDKEIIQIAKKCHEASEELQKMVLDMGSSSGKGNIANAARISIKTMWRSSRLQKLEHNLTQWQQTLDSGLLTRLW